MDISPFQKKLRENIRATSPLIITDLIANARFAKKKPDFLNMCFKDIRQICFTYTTPKGLKFG